MTLAWKYFETDNLMRFLSFPAFDQPECSRSISLENESCYILINYLSLCLKAD